MTMKQDSRSKIANISIEKQKEFYKQFWNSKISLNTDEKCRRDFVISVIKKIKRNWKQELHILDFGCGRGWLTNILSKYGMVVGVDLSVKTAKQLFPDLEFKEIDICSEEMFGKYDVIVSSEVIEHLRAIDQKRYVRNIYTMLDPAGYLILTTPNKPYQEKILKTIDNLKLQPIENWFDKETLLSSLKDYFRIEFFGSTKFCPIVIRNNKLLKLAYSGFYENLSFYKLVNKLLESTTSGAYYTIVARVRKL
jgi:2-polyprenyl-3-methyl-5-hydroxy-6-metoxy-1,4-benzoquinol methylase